MSYGVAIVGASARNFWAAHACRNLEIFGYAGEIWPVNPNYESVYGYRTLGSLAEIEGRIDAVLLAVAAHRCREIASVAVELGIDDIVVVSNGFAETGKLDGAKLQADLVEVCRPSTRLYGPNCVGFADFRRQLCLLAEPVPACNEPGGVSVISQSGALLSAIMSAVLEDGGGLDFCVSLGNAAQFDLARAIAHVCDRGSTQSIAIYAEGLGSDPGALGASLRRARELGIAVVMLKVGRSEAATRVAYSHTASVAGDDAEVAAFLRAHGVHRVSSLEEMARVALLAPRTLSSRGDGVVVLGNSGGQAAIASDLAARDRMKLSKLGDGTVRELRSLVSKESYIENPFDLVGKLEDRDAVYRAIYWDEGVGCVLFPWSVTFPDDSSERKGQRELFLAAIRAAEDSRTPTVISSLVSVPWTDWMLELRVRHPEVLVVRGIDTTIRALSHLFPDLRLAEDASVGSSDERGAENVIGEVEGRRILARLGLEPVAGGICMDLEEAVTIAEAIRKPVIVKVDVTGVAHKARLGLVSSACESADDVVTAITKLEAQLRRHCIDPQTVAGFLVEEMVSGDEFLVGLTRSALGAFVTVGGGGVKARAGTAAETLLLPVDPQQLEAIFTLTVGAVDAQAHGCRSAVDCVMRLASEFLDGGLVDFTTVEINPLVISQEQANIVDVLLIR